MCLPVAALGCLQMLCLITVCSSPLFPGLGRSAFSTLRLSPSSVIWWSTGQRHARP